LRPYWRCRYWPTTPPTILRASPQRLRTDSTGAGYIGTQAGVVYIPTLVQGEGPPLSILPGIDRFVGNTLGIVTLPVITALLRPPSAPAAAEAQGR
jgi:hypothetical protein